MKKQASNGVSSVIENLEPGSSFKIEVAAVGQEVNRHGEPCPRFDAYTGKKLLGRC